MNIEVIEVMPRDSEQSGHELEKLGQYGKVLESHDNLGLMIAHFLAAFKKHRPEVVHAYGYQVCEIGFAALIAGVPKIYLHSGNMRPETMLSNYNWQDHCRWVRSAYSLLAQHESVTIYNNCRLAAADYEDWLGLAPGAVKYIYNGADFSRFADPAKDEISLIRKNYGIADDCKVVGTAFRFAQQKRPLLWIEVARLVAEKMPGIHFLMLGDGPMMKAVKRKINEYHLDHFVHLPGSVDNMSAWYRVMDLVLLTSSMEGTSNVAIEALWCKVPVISCNVGGMSEVIEDQVNGVLLDSCEPETIADRVIDSLKNDQWLEQAGSAGHAFVENRFSLDRMTNEILGLSLDKQ